MGTTVSTASCAPLLAAAACTARIAHRLRVRAAGSSPCCACSAALAWSALTRDGAERHR